MDMEEAKPERAVGAMRSVKESQHLCTCHQAPGWAWRVCSGERDKHRTVSGGEQVTLYTRNGDRVTTRKRLKATGSTKETSNDRTCLQTHQGQDGALGGARRPSWNYLAIFALQIPLQVGRDKR